MRTGLVLAAVLLPVVACGAFGSGDDDTPATPTVDSGVHDLIDAGHAEPDVAVAEAAPDAPTCTTKTLVGALEADTGLVDCGSISYGSDDFVNIGVNNGKGLGLFRFRFESDVVKELDDAKIRSIVLRLGANVNCSACGAGLETIAGTMQAHVARSDWTEGTGGGSYSGADACRRFAGNTSKGWGTESTWSASTRIASPADYDALAHQASVAAGQHEVDIPISSFGDRGKASLAAEKKISFVVEMAGGRFLAATREHAPDAATLTVTYCD